MHGRWWLGMGLAVLAACAEGGVTDPDPAGDSRRALGGVQYEASAISATLLSWPPKYSTFVELRNTTGNTVDVTFPDQCVVLLHVYDNPERKGAPVWRQPRRGAACAYREPDGNGDDTVSSTGPGEPVAPCAEESERCRVRLTLAPGASRRLGTGASAPEIMGDSIPAGRYYVSALIRPNGEPVELAAGFLDLAK